ncbi:hypothetical protein [Paludisphaera rhizosphaerae]|uniref:hypothetical protein n=1 Tax=Paludisphaera rhizosphaerae TaxID=2711216 RepID=UPI0013EC16A9|nr:hypothetical protein [Paludisphaera rhizosphaerae]
MSFQTSLLLYRPQPPRDLTAAKLAGFVREFAALGLSEPDFLSFKIKFGKSVAQDSRPTAWDEPVPGTRGCISTWREIEYDAEDSGIPDLARLADALDALPAKPIYRAWVSLGDPTRPVYEALWREPSEENDQQLGFNLGWSLTAGPIECCEIASDGPFQIGWLAVSLSGQGYPYPWTYRDLIARAEAVPGVPALLDLCRRAWPLDPPRFPLLHLRDSSRAPRHIVQLRKSMGDLWPYDDLGEPWDWCWGISVSG